MSYRELLIGCGARREKDILRFIHYPHRMPKDTNGDTISKLMSDWQDLTTLDINPDHKPNIICDLRFADYCLRGISFANYQSWVRDGADVENFNESILFPEGNTFDEIHAYEVLEHIGQQGDAKTLFAQFEEFHRILKPGGLFCATCPSWCSPWAWGDPSHTRVITSGTLAFLSQQEYAKQIGKTAMSDFRHMYKADFEPLFVHEDQNTLAFVLRARK